MNYVEKLQLFLIKKKLTIAAAESCTGGYVSYLLTKTPGSSQTFKGGFIVYSLDSKKICLNIPPRLLKMTQGVSSQVAELLAVQVKKRLQSDIGISIVGYAGPQAHNEKVGTIYFSISGFGIHKSAKLTLNGTRAKIRIQASHQLLKNLYNELLSSVTKENKKHEN